jgi:hypothetical protein
LNWGYISLTPPNKKPIDIAEEFNRCGMEGAEYLLVFRHPLTGLRTLTNLEPAKRKTLVNAMFKRGANKGALD